VQRRFLWHGNVFRTLNTIQGIIMDLETLHPDDQPSKLLTAAREFDTYLRANAGAIPNYGERYRSGETIASSPAESAVNQVISKRMVKNSKCAGAHAAPTCSSRSAPECSTTTSPPTSAAGTPASPTS